MNETMQVNERAARLLEALRKEQRALDALEAAVRATREAAERLRG